MGRPGLRLRFAACCTLALLLLTGATRTDAADEPKDEARVHKAFNDLYPVEFRVRVNKAIEKVLGVTFYELLTLRLPFTGKSLASLRQQVAEGRPAPVREFLPNVPWEIETVCMAAMDPDPARRYATAAW